MSDELEIILTKYANAVLDAKNGKTNPTLGELVDKPKQAITKLIAHEVVKGKIEELQAVHDHWRKTFQSEKVQSRVEARIAELQELTP